MSVHRLIANRIDSYRNDSVFSIQDFLDLGSYGTAKKAIQRMEKEDRLIRIIDGLYAKRRVSKLTGEIVYPSMTSVAYALARKFSWSIVPSGEHSLNLLRLSDQMPATFEYLSDGPYRSYDVNERTLTFKTTKSKDIKGMSQKTSLVVQALKAIGKDAVTEDDIDRLKTVLSAEEKKAALEEGMNATSWVYECLKKIGGKPLKRIQSHQPILRGCST